MRIEYTSVHELRPHPNNARAHSKKQIRQIVAKRPCRDNSSPRDSPGSCRENQRGKLGPPAAVPARRFPQPWSVEEMDAYFVVMDSARVDLM
jgi:hypothetical protein